MAVLATIVHSGNKGSCKRQLQMIFTHYVFNEFLVIYIYIAYICKIL